MATDLFGNKISEEAATAASPTSLESKNYSVGDLPVEFLQTVHPACLHLDINPLHVQRPEFEKPWPSELEEAFRHSGWRTRRRLIFESLQRTQQSAGRIDAFCKCGSFAAVEYSRLRKRYRTRGNYCHDRFCAPCARARAGKAIAAIRGRVTADRIRFVTLTLKHSDIPLREQILKLRKSFTALRHTPLWKESVTGGCVTMEIKLTDKDEWHPHLHILCEGSWIDAKALKALWYGITGDSYIVDVRSPSTEDAIGDLAKYLSKYITKPCGGEVLRKQDKLDEYVLAMKGVHVIDFLGNWRKFEKLADDADEAVGNDWGFVASLNHLVTRARQGDPIALWILCGVDSPAAKAYREVHESPP